VKQAMHGICAPCAKEDTWHWMEMIFFAGSPAVDMFSFSDSVVADQLMDKWDLKLCRGRGVEEPVRAKQASQKLQLPFFGHPDYYCEAIHAADPSAFTFERFADVPPHLLFNMNEMASNPAHICHNSVMLKETLDALNRNCFLLTPEGNKKVDFHLSAVVTPCRVQPKHLSGF
jgi:hypothetical protein